MRNMDLGEINNKNRYRIISAIIISVCWVPVIIANLPGSVPFDGMTQLLEHFGRIPHYGHHPVFITRLYGLIVQFGASIYSYNLGVFFVVLFQMIFCITIFSKVCEYVKKLGCHKWVYWGLTLFYGLFPVFSTYVSAVMKDTFYMAAVTWFTITLVETIDQLRVCADNALARNTIVSMGISALLMCLSRKEARICVALTLMYLLFVMSRLYGGKNINIKTIVATLIMVLLINGAFNFTVHNILNVPKGEIAEALSIPFQQTARYVTEFPDEVTEEERTAIDLVLPYEKIAESYNPELSDPIKGKMKSGVSKKEYLTYAKTWLQMGLKKPQVYIEATWNNINGYFTPFYRGKDVIQNGIEHSQTERWGTEELDIHYLAECSYFRTIIYAIIYKSQEIPVLDLLYNPGFYFWIIVALIIYCIVKKKLLDSVMLAIPVVTYLVCFASPANGYGRYTLAIYATIWMIMCNMLPSRKQSGKA